MHFSHISIGGGVTGIETVISAFNKIEKELKKSKKTCKKLKFKNFFFAIIDKNPKNIPGGVAYGFDISRFGYFNNPIRLSPIKFIKWLLRKKNKNKLINYLKIYGGYTGQDWLRKNKDILLSNKFHKIKELYIPRTILNFWMEEKLIFLISKMEKASKKLSVFFDIKFFKGEVVAIKNCKGNYREIVLKNNIYEKLNYKITKKPYKKIHFESTKEEKNPILSITQNIGLGLPPPKQLATSKAQKNSNYIWDFYSQGSTELLVRKILTLAKNKKKIRIYFIGYKAGLLESLPELRKLIINKKIKVEMLCSSKDLKSIQKAKLSLNKKTYKFKLLKKDNLHKIKTARKLYFSVLKEFELSILSGYKKYDAWTKILNNNILYICIKNFNDNEKKQYYDIYHHKIRNITRFTYPETISAREKLLKMKILKTKKEIVKKVDILKEKLIVKTKNRNNKINKYVCDIVINVSGPLNAKTIENEVPLVKSLKNKGAKTTIAGGFVVDSNFKIIGIRNVYVPGILSRGFNPERKTIIKAILENSQKAGQSIAKTLIYM